MRTFFFFLARGRHGGVGRGEERDTVSKWRDPNPNMRCLTRAQGLPRCLGLSSTPWRGPQMARTTQHTAAESCPCTHSRQNRFNSCYINSPFLPHHPLLLEASHVKAVPRAMDHSYSHYTQREPSLRRFLTSFLSCSKAIHHKSYTINPGSACFTFKNKRDGATEWCIL